MKFKVGDIIVALENHLKNPYIGLIIAIDNADHKETDLQYYSILNLQKNTRVWHMCRYIDFWYEDIQNKHV